MTNKLHEDIQVFIDNYKARPHDWRYRQSDSARLEKWRQMAETLDTDIDTLVNCLESLGLPVPSLGALTEKARDAG